MPSNFRNFTALTQLIPGMTPNPAASTFEGGQVVANGTPSQQNVYLIDGMYNNDDRLGGSQGTQVRVVLDNIEEYQVLSNQYSAEYGGGAGAIINMVTRGGTNNFSGRVYTYFRDDRFNARGALPAGRRAEAGRADAAGRLRRSAARSSATAPTSTSRSRRTTRTSPGRSGFRPRPRRSPRDMRRRLQVRATNYFGARRRAAERAELRQRPLGARNRADARRRLQHQQRDASTRRRGRATGITWSAAPTPSVLTDRASNVIRVGRIGEELGDRRAGVLRRRREARSGSPAAIRSRSGSATSIRATSPAGAARV